MFWFGKDKGEIDETTKVKKVKFLRTSVPKNTKIPQALEESKKIAKKINEKFDLNFQVYMQRYAYNEIYLNQPWPTGTMTRATELDNPSYAKRGKIILQRIIKPFN